MAKKLKFIKEIGADSAAGYIAQQIQKRLASGKKVAWFLSGGSAIGAAVLAARLLNPNPNLTVTLADERYGPPGHPDSNWEQLIDAGFQLNDAHLEPVLRGGNADQTLADFEHLISGLLSKAGYKIALLGIGADGHTAGILPYSPAVNSKGLVSFYGTPGYQRITLTPKALAMLDEAVVYAMGNNKHQALRGLSNDLQLEIQPAQILKKIPRVTIYNDVRGDSL
ncbi:MAG: 6-phosphogluconolactonase [Candidatus Saccharimonadales bacterium]